MHQLARGRAKVALGLRWVTVLAGDLEDAWEEDFAAVCVAGRIVSINDKGKVFFIKFLADEISI